MSAISRPSSYTYEETGDLGWKLAHHRVPIDLLRYPRTDDFRLLCGLISDLCSSISCCSTM